MAMIRFSSKVRIGDSKIPEGEILQLWVAGY